MSIDTSKLENWSERKEDFLRFIEGEFKTDSHNESNNIMIIGFSKAGKTYTLKTCRKPILHISFDSNNLDSVRGWMQENEGAILPYTGCEQDDLHNPIAWKNYINIKGKLLQSGILENIGTLFIDSSTLMGNSMLWQILKKQRRNVDFDQGKKDKIRQSDWGILLTTMRDEMINLVATPCDVVLTCHLGVDRDEDGDVIGYFPLLSGQSKHMVPAVFSENYIIRVRKTSQGTERYFMIQPTNKYTCGSRFAQDDILEDEEPADIKAILKKAGRRHEDLPLLPKLDLFKEIG